MNLIKRFRQWRLGRRIQFLADQVDEMQALLDFAKREEDRLRTEVIRCWIEYVELNGKVVSE